MPGGGVEHDIVLEIALNKELDYVVVMNKK